MPAKSKAQQRWAYWAEKHSKKAGVSKKVAKEFEHAVPHAPEKITHKKRKGK